MQKFSVHLLINFAVFVVTYGTRINWSRQFHPSSKRFHTGWYNIKLVISLNSRHLRTSHKHRTMRFFLDFWDIFSRCNHGGVTIANITVSWTTQFLRTVHFKSRSRAAKWLRGIFAVMVRNGENGSAHHKFINFRKRHWSVFTSSSSYSRKNWTNHNWVQIRRRWWFGHISIFAISKTISGTILSLGLTTNITGGLGCTHSIETMFVFLDWVAWIGDQLVSHFWLGLGQGISLQFVGGKIIFPLDWENRPNSLLGLHLDRSGSPQGNGVFWHLLVGRVPSFHFFTHFGL